MDMDRTSNYHHCRTDQKPYDVLYHGYMDPITTNYHCRRDLHVTIQRFTPWVYGHNYNLSSL